jgi:hypothetical protein
VPHHQSRENGSCPWRHQDNAVELASVQQSEGSPGQPRRRDCPIEDGLPQREAFGLQRRFQVEGDGFAGKMHERPGIWRKRVSDQSRQPFSSPWSAGHLGEAEVRRGFRRGFADSEERELQGSGEIAVRGKRTQCIAAGDNQGLSAFKFEGHISPRLNEQQRGEHRLVTARGEALGLARGVWFRSRDEDAHHISEP